MELASIDLDTVLRLVANPYRRTVLITLLDSNPTDTTDLPAEMAESDDELTDLRISSSHTHLPMLENARMIEWNRDTNVVTHGPAFEQVQPLLELMDEHDAALPNHCYSVETAPLGPEKTAPFEVTSLWNSSRHRQSRDGPISPTRS